MKITEKGMLLVISGPSGCGKSTIVSNILARDDSYALSVSLTTREKREKEIDGVHYKFVTREDFEKALENDELLEHAEYNGNLYGTPAGPVKEMLDNGDKFDLSLDFAELRESPLKNFLRVKIVTNDTVVYDELLADAFVDEPLVLPVDFTESKNIVLRIIYSLPEDVGNEAKNAEALFELIITASTEE